MKTHMSKRSGSSLKRETTTEKLNEINDTHLTQQEMTAIMEEMNSVSNKEALRDKIHEIHNFLRNNGAGYGMGALKVFNVVYGLKKIEENGLIDKVNLLRPDCEFSYLLGLANNDEGERLAELIFGSVLTSICDNNITKDLLFYEIPRNIRGSVLVFLIKEINKITMIEKSCNVLLSGKIYEYFIGRDESAISELGAYFTDRHIVDFILKKLNPSKNEDGTIPTMIDMFGGSGGFTTGYINFLNEKYPQSIAWNTELNKISHYDMNEDVIKSAGLEFFCLTGVLPDMDNNLRYKNSFTDEFEHKKYKYPLTNPPYGGDKTNKSEAQSKREKVKEYIKNELAVSTDEELHKKRQAQLKKMEAEEKQEKQESDRNKVSVSMCSARIQRFAKVNGVKGNDKESCSLMLLMDIVEVGGTAIGVLKEGVFFNKAYKDLRKCLVENYRVREVISVPQDQFENTSTKTSIVIFDNTDEKTTEVLFSDLVVERYTEDTFGELFGEIVIVQNKNDIVGVSDKVACSATREDILGNAICSLNEKDYLKRELIVGEGYELVKLGDICEFMPKSKRNASFGNKTGQYNFYTSSDKVQKCDTADYNEECLIVGSGGAANIKIDNLFSCSDHNHVIKTRQNMFVYYLLCGKIEMLSDGFSGSVLKNLSKEYLKNLAIPLLTSREKMQDWVDRITQPYNEKNTKQAQIKDLEMFVQTRIKEIGSKELCDEKTIVELTKFVSGGKHNTSFGKNIGQYKFYNSSSEEKLFCDIYEIEDESVIIGFKGNINIHFGKQFTASQHMYVLQINDETKTDIGNIIKYLFYYLINNEKLLTDRMHGTTIKHITKNDLNNIKIKIPKNKQLIQDLEATFRQIETLQTEVKTAETLYKKLIQELSEEAMPTQSNQEQDETVSIPDNEIVEPDIVIAEEPVKKKIVKTKKPKAVIEQSI